MSVKRSTVLMHALLFGSVLTVTGACKARRDNAESSVQGTNELGSGDSAGGAPGERSTTMKSKLMSLCCKKHIYHSWNWQKDRWSYVESCEQLKDVKTNYGTVSQETVPMQECHDNSKVICCEQIDVWFFESRGRCTTEVDPEICYKNPYPYEVRDVEYKSACCAFRGEPVQGSPLGFVKFMELEDCYKAEGSFLGHPIEIMEGGTGRSATTRSCNDLSGFKNLSPLPGSNQDASNAAP